MKNLILATCFFLVASVSFAQSVTISIVGLNTKDSKEEVVFQVNSAELINNLDPRTNQVVGQRIVIEKDYDTFSNMIKEVASTGKILSSGKITYKSGGQTIKFDLSSVVIRNYSWKVEEGESFEESFELGFKTIN